MNRRSGSRAARGALWLGIAVHILFLVSLPTGLLHPLFIEAMEGHGQASDFFGIYQAGANFLAGHSIYDSDDYLNEAPRRVPFFYYYRYLPPTAVAASLAPLLLGPWPAYWVWIALCEGILLLIVLSILRWRRWDPDRRFIMAGLWLGFFPFYSEQVMGQFSIVMAAFLWMVWRHGEDERGMASVDGVPELGPRIGPEDPASGPPDTACGPADTASGPAESASRTARTTSSPAAVLGGKAHPPALTGILQRLVEDWKGYSWSRDRWGRKRFLFGWVGSLSLKTFSALLVLGYLRDLRLKRVLAGTAGTVLLSAPYFLLRPGDLHEFIRLNFAPFAPRVLKGSFGLHSLLLDSFQRVLGPAALAKVEILDVDVSLAGAFFLLVAAVLFLLALVATLRLYRHPHRQALDLALMTLLFFLVFKSIWEYHHVMLLPAVTALYLISGSRWVLACGVVMGLPTLYAAAPLLAGVPSASDVAAWPGWFRTLHFSVKSLPTLGLFLWSLREAAAWNRADAPGERKSLYS